MDNDKVAEKATDTNENILELKHITKLFPGVKAIDDITMSVKKGTVHVIVGENGAGKSTLMKIINGLYKPDEGTIFYNGEEFRATSATQSREMGISMIYQELNIVPEMTVADNIFLGREPMRKNKMFVDNKKLNEMARDYLKTQGLNYNLKEKMKNLSVSQAQMIEIIKAISCNAKLIIMDEPTSAITDTEVDYLFEKIAALKKQGVTIIYISHKMDEIFRIADYISIFRDGRHIETNPASMYDKNKIISMMVGRKMNDIYPKEETETGGEIFRVENFNSAGVFKDISFSLKKGEILGISGLMGAGRTEIVRSIFGLDKKDSGKIFLEGKEIKIKGVPDAIKHGIVMLSENRRRYGLIPVRSVLENIGLVALKYRFNSMWIKHRAENAAVLDMVKKLGVKAATVDTKVQTLSGGNQQKVVLAKWLLVNPKVLILDEPTRGIDVGAKYEIYKLMCELTKAGMSIIMISSELPELIGMSDRIIVVCQGKIAGELSHDEATQVKIMNYATGGMTNAGAAGNA